MKPLPLVLVGALALAGCASLPDGPSKMALPGSGKSFEQFNHDDAVCRDYARVQVGGTANDAAADATVRSAAVGTVIGAAAGAALGGRDGAAVGAGTGLLFGSAAGAGAGQSSAYNNQQRYDNAYVQCMYSKGQRVPVSGRFAETRAPASGARADPAAFYPPPPPNQQAPSARAAPASTPPYWHYCTNPAGYYPYVAKCSNNWQRVPARPASPPPPPA